MATYHAQGTDRYATQHNLAICHPIQFEGAIVRMLENWAYYAQVHRLKYGSPIGEDYVIGVYWLDMARAIHGLLDGETGRLDCGTLSSFIMDTCRENGVDYEKGI